MFRDRKVTVAGHVEHRRVLSDRLADRLANHNRLHCISLPVECRILYRLQRRLAIVAERQAHHY